MDASAQVKAIISRSQYIISTNDNDERNIGLWGMHLDMPVPVPEVIRKWTAEARQARFFDLVHQTLATAAVKRPLLLVLEDTHWADQLSLNLLEMIVSHIGSLPLFIILTFRPSARFTLPLLHHHLCTHIPLVDLLPSEARVLIKQIVGAAHLPEVVEERLGLGGTRPLDVRINPLYLAEVLKLMLSSQVLTVVGERVQVDEKRLNQLQLPDSVYALSLTQLDQLSVAARSLLQVASVIGREFTEGLLLAVTPQFSPEAIRPLLAELEDMQIIQLVTVEIDPIYMFQRMLTHRGGLPKFALCTSPDVARGHC